MNLKTLKAGEIIFDGVSSTTHGFVISNELEFASAQRDIEVIDVPGRSGSILQDNKRYKAVTQPIKLEIQPHGSNTIEQQIQDVQSLFRHDFMGYDDFEWAVDPGYIYQARLLDAKYTRVSDIRATADMSFEFAPVKLSKDTAYTSVNVIKGGTVTNDGTVFAYPKWTLKGTGNITLTVGTSNYKFVNITNGIVIDSALMTVKDLTETDSKFQNVSTYPLPSIPTGNVTIDWDNTNFTVSMIPRFGKYI